jgi:ferritin
MLHPKMQDAINKQINAEYFSAFLYLAMAARFNGLGLAGGANWMNVQFQEELAHAKKFFDYVGERGGTAKLETIAGPPTEWQDALAMFEHAYAHEQKVTGLINGLADLALELKDHATHNFLQWFIAEQVEEEASADAMVQKLKLTKDAPGGIFQLDAEMAARVFTPPAPAK